MQIGVKCSRGYIPHEECRRCALQPDHPCGFTPDILEMMREENEPTEVNANSFTPSRLLDICDRQRVLKSGNDHYVDIKYAWEALRGHAIHALVEKSGRYPGILESIREIRLSTSTSVGGDDVEVSADGEFPGGPGTTGSATFTGKSDFIGLLRVDTPLGQAGGVDCGQGCRGGIGEPDSGHVWDVSAASRPTIHCKIVDYKTTKYIRADFLNPAADPYTLKHVIQINMYRWLVERELANALGRQANVVVDEVELLYLDMTRTVRFTSACPIHFGGKEYAQLPLYPLEKIEALIKRKIRQKQMADKVLPPPLEGFPNHWACQRCPVSDICLSIEEEGLA